MTFNRIFKIAGCLLALSIQPVIAEDGDTSTRGVFVPGLRAVQFDVSPPLRDISPLPVPRADNRGGLMVDPDGEPATIDGKPITGPQDVDSIVQDALGAQRIPDPTVSFDGPDNVSGVSPPDPVGDIGPNHYVAMSNLFFQIYDRSGVSLFGPAANNTLWSGFGGACETENAGDPIVIYDQIDDRWLLTQFTSAGPEWFNCVALSTGPDPTGTYFRWAFTNGSNFPDYPKYGMGRDAYLISTRDFAPGFVGVGVYAISKAEMLVGNPTPTIINFFVDRSQPFNVGDGLLPMDVDGFVLPPAGTPHYFVGSMDNGGPYGAPQDALTLWKLDANFADPPSSTFTLSDTIPISPYNTTFPCPGGGRSCIPQQGTGNLVDIQSYRQRPLHRLSYRNFGSHESMVTNQSVEASAGIAGIRWWEIRSPNASPVLFQEGTFGPGATDGIHRWMGSAALDSAGNIGLAYSASSASMFPSLYYTGRLASDPLGTMPQGEGIIHTGTGSQTGSQRWGDYSSLNVDPLDDCTFWYTNEYLPTTSSTGWRLRIGAFRFDECGTPGFTLSTTSPASQSICAADDAVFDLALGSISNFDQPVTLVATGNPVPTTAVFTVNPVPSLPGSSTLTISNTDTLVTGAYPFVVDASAAGADPRSVNLELMAFDSVPSQVSLITPIDTAVDQDYRPSFEWSGTEAERFTIEVATDIGFSTIVFSQTTEATSVAPSFDLPSNTTLYWRVVAQNACGDSVESAIFSFTTLPAPGDCPDGNVTVSVADYDFESGAQGWVSGSNTGTDTWTLSTANPAGGSTQHWHVDDQSTTSDTFLTSPSISLPADLSLMTFQFQNAQNLESRTAGGCWDGGILEVGVDGGAFSQIDNALLLVDPYDGAINAGPLNGSQAWCGDPQAYLNSVVDIDSLAGSTVQFRFRVSTDSSVGRPGWDIDDIAIQGCDLPDLGAIFSDGFEN